VSTQLEAQLAEPDALELEIFRHVIESVVDELDVNTQRTAHSPVVYEFKDYCCGIVTRDFRLLSQSKYNIPIFVADLGTLVKDSVNIIGEENIEPGDIFVNNYAEVSGSHLNNVTLATPIYHRDDRLAGYVVVRVHWADVGGMAPGSPTWDAKTILQEGVQYRGVKVVSRGRLVREMVATIQANCWMPDLVTGDLMANVAACTLGARRWREQVARRWSSEEIERLIDAQFAASTSLARSKVAELPDGEYRASVDMDDSGPLGSPALRLSIRIEVKGDRLLVDLSELPPQVDSPINCGINGGAFAAMRVAFKSLLVPDRAADEGLFEPLKVVIPMGTVMSATKNAAMGRWNQLPPTLIDLFFRAIGTRLPELVPAGHHGTMSTANVTGIDEKGKWWRTSIGVAGGFGATKEADGYGPLANLMLGDNPQVPLELLEGRYPLRHHSYRLLRRFGGRGLHRGGPGTERVYEVLTPAFLNGLMNRTRDPAWGMAGGEPGQPGAIHIRLPGSKVWRKANKVSQFPIPVGTVIRLRSGGGGGWGTPTRPK
jgi:N-methylhydantoinase B